MGRNVVSSIGRDSSGGGVINRVGLESESRFVVRSVDW